MVPVLDFWTNGDWDHEKLISFLDDGIVDQICALHTGLPASPSPIWMPSADGFFSLSSAWNLVRQRSVPSEAYKKCWSSYITPTMSIFCLRLLQGWIPTIDVLLR